MKVVTKVLDLLENLTKGTGGAFVFLMATLYFAQVIARYVFREGIPNALLVTVMCMVWLCFLLVGSLARQDEHIRIGAVTEAVFKGRARDFRFVVENLVALPLCIYLSHAAVRWVGRTITSGDRVYISASDSYAAWIPHIIVPVGLCIASLFYLERNMRMLNSLLARRKGRRHPESSVTEEPEGALAGPAGDALG